MAGRLPSTGSLILPPLAGLPDDARRLDSAIEYLLGNSAALDHTHATYQPWGVATIAASTYSAPNVAAISAINVTLDANLSGFDVTGMVVGKDHQVMVAVRQDATGGRTFDIADTWTWFSAGTGDTAVEMTMPAAANASAVFVLASVDGGVLDRRAYFLGLVQTIGPWSSWPPSADIAISTSAQSTLWRARRAGRLLKMVGFLATPTVGASFKADLLKSTDDGATFTTVFTDQAHQLTIAAAARTGSTSTFDLPTFDVDDLLAVVYDQVGVATKGKGVNIFVDLVET